MGRRDVALILQNCFNTILKMKSINEGGKNLKKNEDKELVSMVIRIPKYKKKMIKNIAKSQGRYEADIIRNGIDKELNIDLYQDKMEELIKGVLKPVEEKMDKFLKSQRKINAKYLRTMAISAYLNSEVMKNLLGDDLYENFNKMLGSARKKANYYVSRNTEGMSKEDLYDFYIIGDIYREEFRNE